MRRFLIVVETGATPEETKARMRTAIDRHLQGLREDRLPVPEPSAIVDYVDVGP
jgi:predicted RNase H-like HicB family nuclease